jgi:hypothetical protein
MAVAAVPPVKMKWLRETTETCAIEYAVTTALDPVISAAAAAPCSEDVVCADPATRKAGEASGSKKRLRQEGRGATSAWLETLKASLLRTRSVRRALKKFQQYKKLGIKVLSRLVWLVL